MTEQTTSSAPGGTPSGGSPGNTSDNTGQGSFVRTRAAQMAASMQPAPGEPSAADVERQQQQQHAPPAEQKIKVGEAEYTAADLESAIAERAEAQSRKATLPSSADGYEIKLPDDFQAPQGVSFEFNRADGALKAARELAYKHGIPQDVFSQMLGVYASTKMGEAIQQAQMRDVNMKQLGVAGPQRVEAVATWLQARAGAEGQATANFLRQYPPRRSSKRWKVTATKRKKPEKSPATII